MAMLKPYTLIFELLRLVERDLPPNFKSRVEKSLPEDTTDIIGQNFGLKFSDEDLTSCTMDEFSQRHLAPTASRIASGLRCLMGPWLDNVVVFYRLPHRLHSVWSEEVSSPRMSLMMRRDIVHDCIMVDFAYMVRKAEQAAAA